MTSADISKTAVVLCRIIEPDPTRKMCHWFCSRPVRIILMPFDHRTVARRLDEKLFLSQHEGTAEKLFRDLDDLPQKDKIVKTRRDTPSAESMKKYRFRIGRLVTMKLVKQRVRRERWIHQQSQFVPQKTELAI